MSTALFFNFSSEPFVGYWNGKPYTLKAGEKRYMPEYLAYHFAKHLTNRELLKAGKDTATSPKFPDQVPEFMELMKKAYTKMEEITADNPKGEMDETQTEVDILNRQHDAHEADNPKGVQIVEPPKGDDEDEEEFEDIK